MEYWDDDINVSIKSVKLFSECAPRCGHRNPQGFPKYVGICSVSPSHLTSPHLTKLKK